MVPHCEDLIKIDCSAICFKVLAGWYGIRTAYYD